MIRGVDYGYGKVSGKTIKDAGYDFCCRYLSHSPGKNLSSEELADLRENNLRIVLVYETTERRCMDGFQAGVDDANYAKKLAQGLDLYGLFKAPVIYFACDDDFTLDDCATIREYFKGVNSVLGIAHTGVYGGLTVVSDIMDNNLARYGWQTSAWSRGIWYKEAQLRQVAYNLTLDGVQCDIDEAISVDYGQI